MPTAADVVEILNYLNHLCRAWGLPSLQDTALVVFVTGFVVMKLTQVTRRHFTWTKEHMFPTFQWLYGKGGWGAVALGFPGGLVADSLTLVPGVLRGIRKRPRKKVKDVDWALEQIFDALEGNKNLSEENLKKVNRRINDVQEEVEEMTYDVATLANRVNDLTKAQSETEQSPSLSDKKKTVVDKLTYNNGQPCVIRHVYHNANGDEVIHGQFTCFHENGGVESTGEYREGEREGTWHFYRCDGKCYRKVYYEKGRVIKTEDL